MERKRVVVGYDGSQTSEGALADLRRAGLPEQTECIVLTVTQAWVTREEEELAVSAETRTASAGAPVASAAERTHGAQAMHEAHDLAEIAAAKLAAWFPRWSVRAESRPDAPAWGLLERVRELNADLVVVGTHERSAMGRLIHGSVCQSLLVDAPCSVRIARAPWTSQPAGLRIIVALDGQHDADAALRELAVRHWPQGSAVHLVSGFSPVFLPGSAYYGMSVTPEEFDDDDLRAVYDQVDRARTLLEPTGVTVTQSIRLDDPVALLLEEAARWGADAIFLGARGHRAIERILLGSVSAAVARRAHCSVEVIRPWKHVEL